MTTKYERPDDNQGHAELIAALDRHTAALREHTAALDDRTFALLTATEGRVTPAKRKLTPNEKFEREMAERFPPQGAPR